MNQPDQTKQKIRFQFQTIIETQNLKLFCTCIISYYGPTKISKQFFPNVLSPHVLHHAFTQSQKSTESLFCLSSLKPVKQDVSIDYNHFILGSLAKFQREVSLQVTISVVMVSLLGLTHGLLYSAGCLRLVMYQRETPLSRKTARNPHCKPHWIHCTVTEAW